MNKLILLSASAVLLCACTSLSTAPASKVLGNDPTSIAGLFYYLPEGRIHAVGKPDSNGGPYTITITADIAPDIRAAYFIKRDSNYVYDDDISLKTDANGLLTTSNATSTDQTASIIASVVSLVGPLKTEALIPTTDQLKAFDVTFYPRGAVKAEHSLSFENAHKNLQNCGLDLESPSPDFSQSTTPSRMENPGEYRRTVPSDYTDGVAFRLAKAYSVSIVNLDNFKPVVRGGKTLLLPDPSHTYYLDYSRMPFVAKKTNVGFTNGMLSEFDQTVPSPIAGFMSIPKSIIQAIVPIPGASPSSPSGSGAGKSPSAAK